MSFTQTLRGLVLILFVSLAACADTPKSAEGNADEGRQVVVVVGKAGGVLKGVGVKVEIPEGALEKDVTITAKVAQKAPPAGVVAATKVYEFGPKGTKFAKDVKVTFELEHPAPAAKVYFTKEDNDEEFEKLASENKVNEVSAFTKHFSFGFAGTDDPAAFPTDGGADASSQGVDSGTDALDASVHEDDAGVPDVPRVITVESTDWFGRPANQSWAIFQDGDGDAAWQTVPAPVSTGVYSFTVNRPKFAVAFVCTDGSSSVGTILYAMSTTALHKVEAVNPCVATTPSLHQVAGAVTPTTTATHFRWAHPWNAGLNVTLTQAYPTPTPYTMFSVPEGITIDPIIGLVTSGTVTKVNIERNYTLFEDRLQNYNLDTEGFSTTPSTLTVRDVAGVVPMRAELVTRHARSGFDLTDGAGQTADDTSRWLTFASVTGLPLMAGDSYLFFASDDSGTVYREFTLRTQTPVDVDVTLPRDFVPGFGTEGGSYLRPVISFDAMPNAVDYTVRATYPSGQLRYWDVHLAPDWIETIAHRNPDGSLPQQGHWFTFPDLTDTPGFNTNWVTIGASTIDVSSGVVTEESAFGGSLRMLQRSYVTMSLPI